MATFTYKRKIGGREIGIKAKKELAEHIAGALQKPVIVSEYCKELSGVAGESEHSAVFWCPFEHFQIAEREKYQEELNAYIASLPDVVTPETAGEFLLRAKEIFDAYIPVRDKRETPTEKVARNEQVAQWHEQRDAEAKAWRAEHCQGEKQVDIPEGQMAVYLEVTFDDSHSMTDYFAPHCQLGHDMLLGIVSKGPETQRLARSVLARYPELSKLSWEWRTENYSMGHGNYLISDWFGEVEHQAYDGRTKVMTRYEIRMNAYTREMWAYKDYPGGVKSEAKTNGNGNGITITENVEKDGIELRFPGKPGEDVLDNLKANGWRWSRYNGCWYHRANEANRAFAQTVKV